MTTCCLFILLYRIHIRASSTTLTINYMCPVATRTHTRHKLGGDAFLSPATTSMTRTDLIDGHGDLAPVMTIGVVFDHGDELFDVIEALHHSRQLFHEAGGVRAQANTFGQFVVGNVFQLAKQLLRIRVSFEYPEYESKRKNAL